MGERSSSRRQGLARETEARPWRLTLGALGVVYGDIGTSPLYTLRECFDPRHGVAPTPENVLGVLSLVFWALLLMISLKYLSFILRAEYHGEGGAFAILALAAPPSDAAAPARHRRFLLVLGLFGASLLYGDGMITPAISVLGAVEGLQVATPLLAPLVVPITVGILVALFALQRRGTAGVGAIFGPATLVWFVAIAASGLPAILRQPQVLFALNPVHAAWLLVHHGSQGFLVLGAVVLCITGGEALYADLGHFGKRPIRLAWYAVAYPALLLNYFGQGALLTELGAAVGNPFYDLASGAWLYPMVAIATVAAIVASQAMISGAFSLTRQAVQLGYWPRVSIIHTSGRTEGQIYIPEINAVLAFACIALVLVFRESGNLAAAYGMAVTTTMTITSILFYAVARRHWGWSGWRAGGLMGFFLLLDLPFLAANLVKLTHGAWFPLVVAGAVFAAMTTWRRGRAIVEDEIEAGALPAPLFLGDLARTRPLRVPGTAVFMTTSREGIPKVLLHHFKHIRALHERVVLLSVLTERVPEVTFRERAELEDLGQGFYRVTARYGFMQTPDVTEVLEACRQAGLETVRSETSYYLGRETLLTSGQSELPRWRKRIFVFLARNARSATAFFAIPPDRVVEIGAQLEL